MSYIRERFEDLLAERPDAEGLIEYAEQEQAACSEAEDDANEWAQMYRRARDSRDALQAKLDLIQGRLANFDKCPSGSCSADLAGDLKTILRGI